MSTTNFATLAAIGWLTLPSRAPTPPPPPGPPPPTDEGGPAAGQPLRALSLDETSRTARLRPCVPTNPPAQQRRPSWGSNPGLAPGQCAPPSPPARALPGPSRDRLRRTLSSPQSAELHARPRPPRPRRRSPHTRPPLAQATPREMSACGRRRCSDDSPSPGGRTSNTPPPTTAGSAGAFDPNAAAAAPAPALGLGRPARTASDIPAGGGGTGPPATPPDTGAPRRAAQRPRPAEGFTRRRAPSLARSRARRELECPLMVSLCVAQS